MSEILKMIGERALRQKDQADQSFQQGASSFAQSFFGAQQKRQQDEAAVQKAEAMLPVLQQFMEDPQQAEELNKLGIQLDEGNRKQKHQAMGQTFAMMEALKVSQQFADRDLKRRESESLTKQREAAARASDLASDISTEQLPFAKEIAISERDEAVSDAATAKLGTERERLGVKTDTQQIKKDKLAIKKAKLELEEMKASPKADPKHVNTVRGQLLGTATFKDLSSVRAAGKKVETVVNKIKKKMGITGDLTKEQIIQGQKDNPDMVSAADDLAIIFNFMKMLDPGSVVREGEFANAQNSAGVPDRIRNLYNNLMEGTRLNPVQRAEFIETAGGVLQAQIDESIPVIQMFTEEEQALGARKGSIVPSEFQDLLNRQEAPAPSTPEINDFSQTPTEEIPDGPGVIDGQAGTFSRRGGQVVFTNQSGESFAVN